MSSYWVVGGDYRDTRFDTPTSGREEWIGPFVDYETAKKEWARRAWATVDNATTRYRIEEREAPPAG
ncbi:MAG: DUF4170 domain-containing protein [Kiloniellales bacterium]